VDEAAQLESSIRIFQWERNEPLRQIRYGASFRINARAASPRTVRVRCGGCSVFDALDALHL
jgi:hypothetical protein